MQSINDDMDDLFRRAAEDYPLNTDSSDWNKVMQQLHHTDPVLPEAEKKGKNRDYLWLLLLLPIGFICGRYAGNKNTQPTGIHSKEGQLPVSKDNNRVHITDSKKHITITAATNQQNSKTAIEKNSGKKDNKLLSRTAIYEQKYSYVPLKKSVKPGEGTKKQASEETVLNNNLTTGETVKSTENHSLPYHTIAAVPADVKPLVTTIITDTSSTLNSLIVEKKDTVIEKPAVSKAKNKKGIPKEKLFYSFLIGPDASTVKYQHVKKLGYSIGLLGSYYFNKRIGIETGVIWDKKTYYSEGEYFSTKKINLPGNVKIINVDGYCKMIEVPLNMIYRFNRSSSSAWLASAGVSSYLMKNESYDYTSERNNQQYPYHSNYKNSTKNYFSILNFSVGYQHKIRKYSNLIVAPYVKLPLKGIGIGSLPLSSTGLSIVLQGAVH